jgi:predicted Rossmann-fold nucleotide-binding protein
VPADGWRSPEQKDITARILADQEWLARHDVELTSWGPDPASDEVHIHLTSYSDAARDVLVSRYGDAVVVFPGSVPRPRRLNG